MKISMPYKFVHKISLSKQTIINFVGAHPRLVTILAGLGISFTFASVGRFFVHEALTSTVTNFQIDYIDKTSISGIPGVQHATAFACKCDGCGASEFTPGHEAVLPGDASNFAPGQEAKISEGEFSAKDFAPGQEFKKGLK